nr:ankyrin repeat domain-containing protein [uncultured Noviherbaspirillum sp.]
MAIRLNSSGRQYSGITTANEEDQAGSSEEMNGPVVRPEDLREDIIPVVLNRLTEAERFSRSSHSSETTSLESCKKDHDSSSSDEELVIVTGETTANSTTASTQTPTTTTVASQPTYAATPDATLARNDSDRERRRQQKNNAALIAAVKAGDWGAVRDMIHLKVDLDRPDPDGYTALHHAVMLTDMRMAHLLLDNGAMKAATTRQGYTALMLATSKRCLYMVELVAEHRTNMTLTTSSHTNDRPRTDRPTNWTPFHEAALSTSSIEVVERLEIFAKAVKDGDIDTAARMIASGSMVMDEADGNGDTPLVIAATSGNLETIRLLLCVGAKVHTTDRSARSPLMCAAAKRHFAAIKVLLTAGSDPLWADIHGRNALDYAVDADDADLLKALLAGMNAGGRLYKDMPALIGKAAVAGKIASVRMLLDMKADLPDARGCLALAVMATTNQLKAVQTLLAAGANLHHRDRDGHTAFTLAAANGRVDIVKALFAYRPGPLTEAEWIRKLQNETDNDGRSGLMLAALNRRSDMLDLLIEEGAEVLKKDRHGRDAMWWAAAKGGREMTSTLEENKASPYISDMQGNTVFHAAAANGNHDVIRRYCGTTYADSSLNINAPNRDGDTPLILAARHGHMEVVDFLFSRKGKVQVDFLHENRLGQTALHEAGAHGHEAIYKLLMEKEAGLEAVYPVMHAVCEEIIKSFPLAKHILPEPRKHGSPKVDRNGNTVTHRAAINGRADWLGKMLADQPQPFAGKLSITQDPSSAVALASPGPASIRPWSKALEIPNNEGLTPLCLAIREGHFETVRKLLMEGANVKYVNSAGVTPLWLACRPRSFDPQRCVDAAATVSNQPAEHLVQLLLDYGAEADEESFCKQTPLAAASATGDAAIVQRLIRADADVDHVDHNGLTALMLATHLGHVEVAAILLDAGATPDPDPAHGKLSALLLAAESGRDAVIKLLVERGAQIDHVHDDGATALTVASAAGSDSTVALLIGLGANLYIQDKYGKTAMDYAIQKNHYNIIMLLQQGYSTPRDC